MLAAAQGVVADFVREHAAEHATDDLVAQQLGPVGLVHTQDSGAGDKSHHFVQEQADSGFGRPVRSEHDRAERRAGSSRRASADVVHGEHQRAAVCCVAEGRPLEDEAVGGPDRGCLGNRSAQHRGADWHRILKSKSDLNHQSDEHRSMLAVALS